MFFPGKRISVETAKGPISWIVFPLAFEHMEKFSKGVGRAIATLGTVQLIKGASFEQQMQRMLPAIIPVILEDLLDMVEECCVPDVHNIKVKQLPHYLAITIVEAWFDESFGSEEKIRPFVKTVEKIYKKISGKSVDLWGALSAFSSEPDTDSKTSSTDGSPDSPTEDGASPS